MSTQAQVNRSRVAGPVFEGISQWLHRQERSIPSAQEAASFPAAESVLRSLPRREQVMDPARSRLSLPLIEPIQFKTSRIRSLGRLFIWLQLLLTVQLGNAFDQLLRRDTQERRAVRLRKALERAGGTFVKFGQQAAMRIDLLPWAYCVELSKMLDRMTPFPVEQALKAIERTIGRPWQEVFAVIDPKPIGSASIACVYQATLKDGTRVVIKVRRPGIAEVFMADLQVLDWVAELAEFFTILRPGFTRNLRIELKSILSEELDFRREGRFQDTFRRNAKKSGRTFFTAPRVFFKISGDEVLVQEFISGLWLWEVIAAVEKKDSSGRELLKRLNIDPAVVARRVLWAAFWSMDENVFFHADPHPANILVRPNNEVTFIDFGSCGSFNSQQRIALEQLVTSMRDQDAELMTHASLNLMQPLPPVDLPSLVKLTSEEYLRVLHTFNTPAEYTQYWERTSARQWFVLIRVAQKFSMPLNLHMLRMIRATLLYDSIVLRLDNQLSRYQEYTEFMKDRAELVKLRWRKRLKDDAGDGLFLNLEEIGKTINDVMIRAQTTLGRPIVDLGSTIDKWVFTVSVISRMAGRILLVTALAMTYAHFEQILTNQAATIPFAFQAVIQNRLYQVFLVGAGLLNLRHILFRLQERDSV